MDLALNNLKRLICHKTQTTKPNQTKPKGVIPIGFKKKYLTEIHVIGMVSSMKWNINLCRFLNAKAIIREGQMGCLEYKDFLHLLTVLVQKWT